MHNVAMYAAKRMVTSPSRPPTRDRSMHCTHVQLTRLFDEFGCDKCSVCHRRPSLGWLYRCTQDSEGFLPSSDFSDVEDSRRYDYDAQLYTLSPSIIEAAQKGHYTDHELDILWKQKVEVRTLIRQVRPQTCASASSVSSSQYSLPASTTASTLPSTNSDTDPDSDTSQLSDYVTSCRGPLEPIQEVHDDLEAEAQALSFVKPALSLPCTFKVCQTCRPIYRERAWQSLNAVLESPAKPPPEYELGNRRISDAQVVKHIGLSDRSLPYNEDRYMLRRSIRNSRTDFQDTVQKLLRSQDTDEEAEPALLRHANKCSNLAQLVTASIDETITSDSSSDDSSPPEQYKRADDESG